MSKNQKNLKIFEKFQETQKGENILTIHKIRLKS